MRAADLNCITRKALLAALIISTGSAHAAAPGGGEILKQIKPVAPPAPSSTQTDVTIEQQQGQQLPPSAPFEVRQFKITGNTLFSTESLHALVAEGEGRQLTLAQVDALAARITRFYRDNNYPLARAVIPAQTISEGVVTIRVVEARYGTVSLLNGSRVSHDLMWQTLAPLQSGQMIGQREMDRVLLLLSDIPGVGVSAKLQPGEEVGTSNLSVNALREPAITGNVTIDNHGNRYTGEKRISATANRFNPFWHGDLFSVSVLTSGVGMIYGRASYETLLNGRGTRTGGSFTALNYELGDTMAPLQANGAVRAGSVWARHPFIRGRELNLYGEARYDRKSLKDRIDSTDIRNGRTLGSAIVSLSGDSRDMLLSGGVNTWSLGLSSGQVDFDDAAAASSDASSARTAGGFNKWNLNFSRQQRLAERSELYLSLAGQRAGGNLDSAEKISVGGPYSVRAYDVGAVSGDSGYTATVELRHTLSYSSGVWQLSLFADSAHVVVNKEPWTTGINGATLQGAGIGLSWAGPGRWYAKASIASRVGALPELLGSDADTSHGWLSIGKEF